MLSACAPNQACEIPPGGKFSGTGLLVVRRGQGQDGSFHLEFFPVCHLDTAHLLASLRQAETGLFFFTNQWDWVMGPTTYGQIRRPFRRKMLVLTAPGPVPHNVHCWNCGLNDIFVVPVHITFSDTLKESLPPRLRVYDYPLKAREATIPLRLRVTGRIRIEELSPL
ncbi:hypothetical protein EAH73_12670 [Hymenobacter nivis]|uniref:Uncharacterized protein n=1 Tax=Hymenobacter nivis TaxID=1850093 RepID=A0A502GTT1_9BACT|nr:hypothetical protein EAH73_12670 [Hymenobacter nivis]